MFQPCSRKTETRPGQLKTLSPFSAAGRLPPVFPSHLPNCHLLVGVYALQKKEKKKKHSTCKPLCPLAPAECSPLTITTQSATRGPTVRAPGVASWKRAHVLVPPNSEREEIKASAGWPPVDAPGGENSVRLI